MALMGGAAVVDITPRTPCFLAGYAGRDHEHEGVHDPLSLRTLYVRGANGDVLMVSADILWFYEDAIGRVLPLLEAELGLLPENVFFCGTHTHSAPIVNGDRVNREWLSGLEKQVVAAAALAKSRLQPVELKVGRGTCKIGINRREQRPDGEVVLGKNPDGPIDREMIVVAVDTADAKPVARVCNFACHGVVLGQRNYRISGDWPGLAASAIEANTGAPFLFFNGGAANVNPRVGPQDSFEPVEELAAEFVGDFKKICEKLEEVPEDEQVGGAGKVIHLPRKLRDVEDGRGKVRKIFVRGLRIGSLRMAGFPGEVFSETTEAVKAGSLHGLTMVGSYAGGGHGGYVPVDEAYETGGYEVQVSPYAEGAEAVLRAEFLELLKMLA